ncbi:MAG: threonine/serine exporter [Bacteroides sp.]|nr:threonine/serine exporter [Bacteroidales bacterium]MBD5290872.1 threonine/serine exporter [Bacteroides sp.]
MIGDILQDALFAAIAAIGFTSISRPPRLAYLFCGLIAAAGHSARYLLMSDTFTGMHILPATFLASLLIGCLSVFLSPIARFPAETCLFPSLLPMIPGMYAYKAFGAFVMCIMAESSASFDSVFFLFAHNALICGSILLAMVVGATIPIFIFSHISFQATR